MDELTRYLVGFRRRLRLRDGWSLAQRTVWLPALAALVVQLVGRLLPVERVLWWTLVPFGIWFFTIIVYTLFLPIPLLRVARRVDHELSLHDRLSTAVELGTPGSGTKGRKQMIPSLHLATRARPATHSTFPATPGPYMLASLVAAQRSDALACASRIQPAADFPLTWMPRSLFLASALAGAALLSAFLPNPMDRILAERAALRQEAARQAERVEEMRTQIESESASLTEEEHAQLQRELEELAEALRQNPGDLEQALADLSAAEKALKNLRDPHIAIRQAGMEALANRLQELSGQPSDPQQSPDDAVASALDALAEQLDSMQPSERLALTEELARSGAQASQAGSTELGQALASLAQAVQSGDAQAQQQARQQVQQALAQEGQHLQTQTALQNAAGQLAQSRQALAQAGNQQTAQALGSSQSGAGQGQQSGSVPGSGQNPAQGQPGGGGGSQANQLPPANSSGQAGRPQGEAQSAVPGALPPGNGQLPETASGGAEMYIPGLDTGQGETQVIEGQQSPLGLPNPAIAPYTQAYYQYMNAANQAMQRGYVPPALQEYIRQYFTGLEPR